MKDSLRTLILSILWGGAQRKIRFEKPYVIAITGSVGKTSTKEAIAKVMQYSGRPVIKTEANLGSDFGVPLSLLGFMENPTNWINWLRALLLAVHPPLKKYPQIPYYILEYSADKPGDIDFLTGKIPPDVAVLTVITPVHMANYATLEDLATEKMSLVSGLKPTGYAILNTDDSLQKPSSKTVEVFWYGRHGALQDGISLRKLRRNEKGFLALEIEYRINGEKQAFSCQTQLIAEHLLGVVLPAIAVGLREGVSIEGIQKGIAEYEVPAGRGRVLEGIRTTTLIDDTYNSSQASAIAGLLAAKEMAGSKRLVAILGKMNEMGDLSEQAHVAVAEAAAAYCQEVHFVGPYAELMAERARATGGDRVHVLAWENPGVLLDGILNYVQPSDVVYVKASQNGMYLERVVKILLLHPEEAEKVLVRQQSYWQKFYL